MLVGEWNQDKTSICLCSTSVSIGKLNSQLKRPRRSEKTAAKEEKRKDKKCREDIFKDFMSRLIRFGY